MRRLSLYKNLISTVVLLLTGTTSFCQLNPFSVGTVNPGDSVVIYYDVTINTPCGCSQISNQGTVSGGNFPTFNSNDPKTAAANDPTITLLNLFPLPVTLFEFQGNQKESRVELSWKASEINVRHYEIEKSTTGLDFAKVGMVQAVGSGEHSYGFIDQSLSSNINYYRLKIIDRGGKTTYSSILKFASNSSEKSISVYPNPVLNLQVIIKLSNLSAGQYMVQFYNSIGQQAFSKIINHAGGSTVVTLSLTKKIGKGLFTVMVKGQQHVLTHKVLIEE